MDDRTRHQRLSDLILAALDLPPDRRASFVHEQCVDDRRLATEALELLEHAERPTAFLQSPPGLPDAESLLDWAAASLIGRTLGGCRIERHIASGGMGHVYEAVQTSTQRRVAVKVLASHAMSRSIARRFALESEAQGQLDHPGIARIFGAGVEDDGFVAVPYIVMEFVENALTPIAFADAGSLDAKARVELVLQACDALSHAHSRGYIHRDLKPSNLLVDSRGVLHVIDFGIAKALTAPIVGRDPLTLTGEVVGTPRYMSPEQFSGRPDSVTVASDIYSLGIVLYELIAQRLPFDFPDDSVAAVAQVVRSCDPIRLRSAVPSIDPDLEAVIMHAIERQPEHRYPTMTAFADDLRAALNGTPVKARAPSFVREMRATLRRRPLLTGSIAVAIVMVTLVAAIAGAAYFRVRNANLELRREQGAREVAQHQIRTTAAAEAINADNGRSAAQLLAPLPPDYSPWEVRHLRSRTDTSVAQRHGRIPGTPIFSFGLLHGEPVIVSNLDERRMAIWTVDDAGQIRSERIVELDTPMTIIGSPTGRWNGGRSALVGSEEPPLLLVADRNRAAIIDWSSTKATTRAERLLDLGTGSHIPINGAVSSARDGSVALTFTGEFLVWRAEGGTASTTAHLAATDVFDSNLALSPCGTIAVLGLERNRLQFWSLTDAAPLRPLGTVVETASRISAVALNAGGTRLGVIETQGRISMWSIDRFDPAHGSGSEARAVSVDERIFQAGACAIAFSPTDPDVFAVASMDGYIRLWRLPSDDRASGASTPDGLAPPNHTSRSTVSLVAVHWGHTQLIRGLHFSPDGLWLASFAEDHSVRVWPAFAVPPTVDLPYGHSNALTAVASPSGRCLYASGFSGVLTVWDPNRPAAPMWSDFVGTASLQHLVIMPKSSLLIGVDDAGHMLFWDITDEWNPRPLDAHRVVRAKSTRCKLALSPDGRTFALGIGELHGGTAVPLTEQKILVGTVDRSGDRISVHMTGSLACDDRVVHAIAFSEQGDRLLVGLGRDVLRPETSGADPASPHPCMMVVNIPSLSAVWRQTSTADEDSVLALQPRPDGTIWRGGADGSISLLLAADGSVLRSTGPRAHNGPVLSLLVSPDGTRLFSGSRDGALKVWNTDTLMPVASLRTARGDIRSLEVLRSGHDDQDASNEDFSILSAGHGIDGADNVVQLWEPGTDARTRLARARWCIALERALAAASSARSSPDFDGATLEAILAREGVLASDVPAAMRQLTTSLSMSMARDVADRMARCGAPSSDHDIEIEAIRRLLHRIDLIRPHWWLTQSLWALVHLHQNAPEEALATLERVEKVLPPTVPSGPHALAHIKALALVKSGRTAEAEQLLAYQPDGGSVVMTFEGLGHAMSALIESPR